MGKSHKRGTRSKVRTLSRWGRGLWRRAEHAVAETAEAEAAGRPAPQETAGGPASSSTEPAGRPAAGVAGRPAPGVAGRPAPEVAGRPAPEVGGGKTRSCGVVCTRVLGAQRGRRADPERGLPHPQLEVARRIRGLRRGRSRAQPREEARGPARAWPLGACRPGSGANPEDVLVRPSERWLHRKSASPYLSSSSRW